MINRLAFTFIEVLFGLGVIVVILVILIPSLDKGHGGHRPVCSSNLKAIGTMLTIYESQYHNCLPRAGDPTKLQWLCDEPLGTLETFASAWKATIVSPISQASVHKMFYCPSNLGQDPAKLSPWEGKEIWGYAMMIDRGPGALQMPQDFPKREPPLGYIDKLSSASNTADTELAFDWIISNHATGGAIDYLKTQRYGTPDLTMSSSHMNGNTPAGGNVLGVDGHVEWRSFTPAKAVAVRQGGPDEAYFWIPNP